MTEDKRCPSCGDTKPRTREHWYFSYKGKQMDSYCIECRRVKAELRAAGQIVRTAQSAISAYRANTISTLDLYLALRKEHSEEKAQRIVAAERAAHGLPEMEGEV